MRAPQESPWIGAVLALALALRIYAISGDLTHDSVAYAQNAYNLAHGTFDLRNDSWLAHRLPVFVPAAPLYAAFGASTWTTHLWPLVVSLAQVALVLWLGATLFGSGAAIVSGMLLALLPLDVMQAGVLGPDGVLATFLTAAAACWIVGFGAREPKARLLLTASGVCLALGTVTRLYAVLLVSLYLGDVVVRRRRWTDLLWPALGFLAVALPLGLLYRSATGDPFFPLRVVAESYGSRLRAEPPALQFYPSHLWHPESPTGLFPLVFGVAVGYSLIRRSAGRTLLLLWSLPFLLYLEFGTMSFSAYAPIFKRTRFLTPLAAPFSLLAGSMVIDLWCRVRAASPSRRRAASWLAALGFLAIVADSLWVLRRDRAEHTRLADQTRTAVAVLRTTNEPIYFDHWRTALRFSYYFGFREKGDVYVGADDRVRMAVPPRRNGRFRYLAWYPEAAHLPRGWVVLDDEALAETRRADRASSGPFRAGEVPAYATHPPSCWVRRGRFGAWSVYANVCGPVERGGSAQEATRGTEPVRMRRARTK